MITSKHTYGPWIQLHSGTPYDFGTGECPGLDFVADIAYPLARLPRYLHHCSDTWAIGAHAAGAAKLAKLLGLPVRVQYLALHHDDHEALIGDTPSPIKVWLNARSPEVKQALIELEDHAQEAVSRAVIAAGGVNCNPADAQWTDEERAHVRTIDMLMLLGEARVIKVKPPRPWGPTGYDERAIETARTVVRGSLAAGANVGPLAQAVYLETHKRLVQEIGLASV